MTLLLVGFLLPVVAVSAVLCGHVGEAWPPGVWWRAWRTRAARSRLSACLPAEQPPNVLRLHREAHAASQPPSRPSPSWARKEAA